MKLKYKIFKLDTFNFLYVLIFGTQIHHSVGTFSTNDDILPVLNQRVLHCRDGQYYPDSENCRQYYECKHWMLLQRKCPGTNEFDPVYRLCLPSKLVKCKFKKPYILTTTPRNCNDRDNVTVSKVPEVTTAANSELISDLPPPGVQSTRTSIDTADPLDKTEADEPEIFTTTDESRTSESTTMTSIIISSTSSISNEQNLSTETDKPMTESTSSIQTTSHNSTEGEPFPLDFPTIANEDVTSRTSQPTESTTRSDITVASTTISVTTIEPTTETPIEKTLSTSSPNELTSSEHVTSLSTNSELVTTESISPYKTTKSSSTIPSESTTVLSLPANETKTTFLPYTPSTEPIQLTTLPETQECESEQIYVDPKDCRRFYFCSRGKIYEEICQSNFLFHPERLVCLPEYLVTCVSNPDIEKLTTSSKSPHDDESRIITDVTTPALRSESSTMISIITNNSSSISNEQNVSTVSDEPFAISTESTTSIETTSYESTEGEPFPLDFSTIANEDVTSRTSQPTVSTTRSDITVASTTISVTTIEPTTETPIETTVSTSSPYELTTSNEYMTSFSMTSESISPYKTKTTFLPYTPSTEPNQLTTLPETQECESDQVYADPKDCRRFYFCTKGKIYEEICQSNFLFHPERMVCLPEYLVTCLSNSVTEELTNSSTSPSEDIKTPPNETDEKLLKPISPTEIETLSTLPSEPETVYPLMTTDERWSTLSVNITSRPPFPTVPEITTSSTLTDLSQSTTELTSIEVTDRSNEYPTSTSGRDNGTEYLSTTPDKVYIKPNKDCISGQLFVDPMDCQAFYFCLNGQQYRETCQKYYLFHPTKLVCLPASLVPCSPIPIDPTIPVSTNVEDMTSTQTIVDLTVAPFTTPFESTSEIPFNELITTLVTISPDPSNINITPIPSTGSSESTSTSSDSTDLNPNNSDATNESVLTTEIPLTTAAFESSTLSTISIITKNTSEEFTNTPYTAATDALSDYTTASSEDSQTSNKPGKLIPNHPINELASTITPEIQTEYTNTPVKSSSMPVVTTSTPNLPNEISSKTEELMSSTHTASTIAISKYSSSSSEYSQTLNKSGESITELETEITNTPFELSSISAVTTSTTVAPTEVFETPNLTDEITFKPKESTSSTNPAIADSRNQYTSSSSEFSESSNKPSEPITNHPIRELVSTITPEIQTETTNTPVESSSAPYIENETASTNTPSESSLPSVTSATRINELPYTDTTIQSKDMSTNPIESSSQFITTSPPHPHNPCESGTLYPDYSDCHKFYICICGELKLTECDDTFVFHPKMLGCRPSIITECTSDPTMASTTLIPPLEPVKLSTITLVCDSPARVLIQPSTSIYQSTEADTLTNLTTQKPYYYESTHIPTIDTTSGGSSRKTIIPNEATTISEGLLTTINEATTLSDEDITSTLSETMSTTMREQLTTSAVKEIEVFSPSPNDTFTTVQSDTPTLISNNPTTLTEVLITIPTKATELPSDNMIIITDEAVTPKTGKELTTFENKLIGTTTKESTITQREESTTNTIENLTPSDELMVTTSNDALTPELNTFLSTTREVTFTSPNTTPIEVFSTSPSEVSNPVPLDEVVTTPNDEKFTTQNKEEEYTTPNEALTIHNSEAITHSVDGIFPANPIYIFPTTSREDFTTASVKEEDTSESYIESFCVEYERYPDPRDCKYFYVCLQGEYVKKPCPRYEEFNSMTRMCLPKFLAKCVRYPQNIYCYDGLFGNKQYLK